MNKPMLKDVPNLYSVVCKVTGETKKTNPKQFTKTADLVGVSVDTLHKSYVSREGKKLVKQQLKDQTIDREVLVDKYGLNPDVVKYLFGL